MALLQCASDTEGNLEGLLAPQMALHHLNRHVYICGSLAGCPHCAERDMHLMDRKVIQCCSIYSAVWGEPATRALVHVWRWPVNCM